MLDNQRACQIDLQQVEKVGADI